MLSLDRVNGSRNGLFDARGVTVTEYAYTSAESQPGYTPYSPYGDCTYSAHGSSSAVTEGAVGVFINEIDDHGVLSFAWTAEDGDTPPKANWTFTETARDTCTPYGFRIVQSDDVIYGGLSVCAGGDDPDDSSLHYHVPVRTLVRDENGQRVMRGSATDSCQPKNQRPLSGSATVEFDLVYEE